MPAGSTGPPSSSSSSRDGPRPPALHRTVPRGLAGIDAASLGAMAGQGGIRRGLLMTHLVTVCRLRSWLPVAGPEGSAGRVPWGWQRHPQLEEEEGGTLEGHDGDTT